ncbi:MAG TPA: hypothetical protein DHU89_08970 [Flavobacteriales bacterium]|nr:hypothetical protein [Flavobacteriales bacterium]|tara:strand:- start:27565 stop:27930 length:366 start_codon:yes stop_codon:yes gene_type:complete
MPNGSYHEMIWKNSNKTGAIITSLVKESQNKTSFIKNVVIRRTPTFLNKCFVQTVLSDFRYVFVKPRYPLGNSIRIDATRTTITYYDYTEERKSEIVSPETEGKKYNSPNSIHDRLWLAGF